MKRSSAKRSRTQVCQDPPAYDTGPRPGRYIHPFTDFGFKKLFGEEVNKDLLMDFLNELLRGKQHIADLSYRRTEMLGSSDIDRKAVFDLYCLSDTGERFIVEIQKVKQTYFKDRSIFYSTFPIREQAPVGDWDFQLNAVYTIGILNFVVNDDDRDKVVVTEVQLMDTAQRTVFYDKLTYLYLQMPNFRKTLDELETRFDKWLFVLKNLPLLDARPPKLRERVFEKLFRAAEIARFDPEERMAYETSLKVYRDLKNVFDTARRDGWREGEAKGRAEGREEGRAEGRAEGELEGRRRALAESARRMLKLNIDRNAVAAALGLSPEDLPDDPENP